MFISSVADNSGRDEEYRKGSWSARDYGTMQGSLAAGCVT